MRKRDRAPARVRRRKRSRFADAENASDLAEKYTIAVANASSLAKQQQARIMPGCAPAILGTSSKPACARAERALESVWGESVRGVPRRGPKDTRVERRVAFWKRVETSFEKEEKKTTFGGAPSDSMNTNVRRPVGVAVVERSGFGAAQSERAAAAVADAAAGVAHAADAAADAAGAVDEL